MPEKIQRYKRGIDNQFFLKMKFRWTTLQSVHKPRQRVIRKTETTTNKDHFYICTIKGTRKGLSGNTLS